MLQSTNEKWPSHEFLNIIKLLIIVISDTTGASTWGTDLHIWLLRVNHQGWSAAYNHKITDFEHQSWEVWSIWWRSWEILHLNHYRGQGGGFSWEQQLVLRCHWSPHATLARKPENSKVLPLQAILIIVSHQNNNLALGLVLSRAWNLDVIRVWKIDAIILR